MTERIRDYNFYRSKAELTQRRAGQDTRDARRHRDWDLSAQDRHAKSERFHFAVVGEGSRSATERYLVGYAVIDWTSP